MGARDEYYPAEGEPADSRARDPPDMQMGCVVMAGG